MPIATDKQRWHCAEDSRPLEVRIGRAQDFEYHRTTYLLAGPDMPPYKVNTESSHALSVVTLYDRFRGCRALFPRETTARSACSAIWSDLPSSSTRPGHHETRQNTCRYREEYRCTPPESALDERRPALFIFPVYAFFSDQTIH